MLNMNKYKSLATGTEIFVCENPFDGDAPLLFIVYMIRVYKFVYGSV